MMKHVFGPLLCALTAALALSACAPVASGATLDPGAGNEPRATAEPSETRRPAPPNLEAIIEVPERASVGDAVELRFTLVNRSATGLYVLTWYTPLEGIAGEIFRIERDGEPMPYLGLLAMRGDPTPDDYVFLEAGASVSTTVDLAASGDTGKPLYDFAQPGEYTIAFISPRISHVARTEGEMAASVDELGAVDVRSNRVSLEIVPVAAADPAAGLVYTAEGALWAIDTRGEVVPLVDPSPAGPAGGRISPDGRWVVFSAGDGAKGGSDVWLVDLASDTRRNLTNTPQRQEADPVWWPGRPDVVLFGSDVALEAADPGYPTLVHINGDGYQVLDVEQGGPRAPSPDGRAIAYGGHDGEGSIYRWDGGTEPFEPTRYGLAVEKLYQPAWRPDGQHLAWKVGGELTGEGTWQLGIAIFDLQAETAYLLHPYEPVGGTFPDDLAWSPDGEGLAFVTYQEPPASGRLPNLWVVRPQDGEEVYVGAGVDPTWSPDGRQLAFSDVSGGQGAIALAEAGAWQIGHLELPHEAQSIRGWVRPGSVARALDVASWQTTAGPGSGAVTERPRAVSGLSSGCHRVGTLAW